MFARYFVLMQVTNEKADSHEYSMLTQKGRKTLTAKSDNIGNSVLALSQKVLSLFWANSRLPCQLFALVQIAKCFHDFHACCY